MHILKLFYFKNSQKLHPLLPDILIWMILKIDKKSSKQ